MLEANALSVRYKENGICVDCTSSLSSAAVPVNCWVQRVSDYQASKMKGLRSSRTEGASKKAFG